MNKKLFGAATMAALLIGGIAAATVATTVPAHAQNLGKILGIGGGSRQSDKNNMRNIGIGAGAAAGYELLKGKGTNALILGAGAAYAGKKYEDERKAENRDSSYRRVYNYRDGRRVGYSVVNGNGHTVARYNRNYANNHWGSGYHKVS